MERRISHLMDINWIMVNLVIAEDEVEVIRVIYDRYIHTNEGVAGVAKYLNRNGYTKEIKTE